MPGEAWNWVLLDMALWIAVLVVLVMAMAWYLSYSAARLDRLHAKVEGALSALDAALVRRSEAAIELANSQALDPASALMVAEAATASLERTNARDLEHDLLEGQRFAGRERVESELTEVLSEACGQTVGAPIAGSNAVESLQRLREASTRVRLARRFHNEAVKEVQRVRGKRTVRLFRLAGHAAMPQTVEFDDTIAGVDTSIS